jgi:hypothetical protein
MISIEDCIGMCDLTREEIDAIAEHEHLTEIAATSLADYLMHLPDGPQRVRAMIQDDIREALAHGNRAHAKELFAALRHFLHEHPEARPARA